MKESLAEMESDSDCSEDMSTPTLRTVPLPVKIVEQDSTQLGETIKEEEQEPHISPKCKVEIRHFKYKAKPHRYIEKVVKPKKVKEIITPESIRERNREKSEKSRNKKRILKEKNNPKPNPLTGAQRIKRFRDKKKTGLSIKNELF